jgi:cation:H+ antiporter
LIVGLTAYTLWAIVESRRETKQVQAEYQAEFDPAPEKPAPFNNFLYTVLVAIGLALLILGARWFLYAAVEMARTLGVSELVIGLTIVAAGTSLPEVATSIVAAIRAATGKALSRVPVRPQDICL